jgi:predicted phage tail protein
MEDLISHASAAFSQAQADALQPLRERIAEALRLEGEAQAEAIRTLRADLPAMLAKMNVEPETAQILDAALNQAAAVGTEKI